MGAEAAVAAAAARARRRVISHFLSRNAVSAADAVPFTPERRMETRFFDRMRDNGVIVAAPGGDRYWIDVVKLDAFQTSRRKRVGFGIAAALAAIAAGVGIGLLG